MAFFQRDFEIAQETDIGDGKIWYYKLQLYYMGNTYIELTTIESNYYHT